jgi:hypothetical protein
MTIWELNPVMSKGVESVSVITFPAAAVMDELSEVQLAMVLVLLLVADTSMVSARINRSQMLRVIVASLPVLLKLAPDTVSSTAQIAQSVCRDASSEKGRAHQAQTCPRCWN